VKISLNAIKQFGYDDLFKLPIDQLVEKIGAQLGGLEELPYNLGALYDGVVVAKILSCVDHPNADRLHVCVIDDGGVVKDVERDKDGHIQVVCGAPNAREGILVAWLPPGTTVPASIGKEPFVLTARDFRGVMSNGMLASPSELAMSENHDGILEIDPFISVDRDGVGELVKIGVARGRKTRPNLKVGICGEHGGDPASVSFCHQIGLDYVSCSPYRVPIARLAAAQAALGKASASQA